MRAGSRLLTLRMTSAPAGVAPSTLAFCRRKRTASDLTVLAKSDVRNFFPQSLPKAIIRYNRKPKTLRP